MRNVAQMLEIFGDLRTCCSNQNSSAAVLPVVRHNRIGLNSELGRSLNPRQDRACRRRCRCPPNNRLDLLWSPSRCPLRTWCFVNNWALKRTVKRPPLRTRDRLFWILLATAWRDWRGALVFVRPDTVVRWHREWLRRRWTARSHKKRPGRPTTDVSIRKLVQEMIAANPL